jgi:8-oxo-(d)GTP phosphatase
VEVCVVGVIPAAGTIPWRRRRGELQVALVHRPKYDDWSWAKGKLDTDEEWPVAAVRETHEETALEVRLGRPLPGASYTVLDRDGEPVTKEVRYWAAEVTGGGGPLANEIDEVRWLDVASASDRLDYARDREQLRALVRADNAGALTTWPLVLARHAKALPRSGWKDDDQLRPLDGRGLDRAEAIVPLLTAYGVRRLVSSPSVRCADTLRPYAALLGTPLKLKDGLSEEGYAADQSRAPRHLRRLIERGAPAALCSHGPVLPGLLDHLAGLVDGDSADGADASKLLDEAARSGMGKGEVLVAHLVDTGEQARVVAIERHPG